VAGVVAQRNRAAVAGAMPPWVPMISTSLPVSLLASQPIPAFCVMPNRLPLGDSISICGVSGSAPCGPAAWVMTA
jgi:hypothetical protein